MDKYGLKIGTDSFKATNDDSVILNKRSFNFLSTANTLKTFARGRVSLSSSSFTVTHSLGYLPVFFVFRKTSGILYPLYYDTSSPYAYITIEELKINGTGDFYYYIFYDPIT